MYLNCQNIALNKYCDRSLYQVEVDENFLSSVAENRHQIGEQSSRTEGKSITFIIFIFLLLLTAGLVLKNCFQKLNKERLSLTKHNSKVACRKCYFFSNNHHLRCAVHPDKVLTKKAQDCRDYQTNKTR